jgi:hypothetical protein
MSNTGLFCGLPNAATEGQSRRILNPCANASSMYWSSRRVRSAERANPLSLRTLVDRATSWKVYCGLGLEAPTLAPKTATSSWAQASVRNEAPRINAPNIRQSRSFARCVLARLLVERDARVASIIGECRGVSRRRISCELSAGTVCRTIGGRGGASGRRAAAAAPSRLQLSVPRIPRPRPAAA